MKISGQKELAVAAILIVFIAFVPMPTMVKDALRTSVGKVVALALIVYSWKYVSAIIALLLLVIFARDSGAVSEYYDQTPIVSTCKCDDPNYTPNASGTACVDKNGVPYAPSEDCGKGVNSKAPILSCQCPSGWVWDKCKGTCGQPAQSNQSAPIAAVGTAPAPPAMTSTAAPVTSTGPVTSPNMPMTTGSAAGQTIQTSGPQAMPAGGVQPAMGTSSTTASV
jgi:hypothetical protein